MKRKLLTSVVLSVILVASVLCGSLVAAVAEGEPQGVLTVNDFNATDWEQDLSDFESQISFVTESKNYESTVYASDALNGSYSVVFNFGTLAGYNNSPIQMVVALGASAVQVPLNPVAAYYNTSNDNTLYLAFSGTKVYVFDRASGNGAGSYQDNAGGSGVNDLGTPYWKHLYNFYSGKGASMANACVKLEVISGETTDTLNIYVANTTDFSTVSDCSVSLHKKGVADGYLQFSQAKSVYNNVIGSYCVKNLKINDVLIKKNELLVLGRTDLVSIENTYPTNAIKIYDKNASTDYVISNFIVNDLELEDDSEVFTLTLTEKRLATENNNHKWGIVLGVDESGDLSTGTEIKFARNGLRDADTIAGICTYHCTATPAALTNLTYTIKGYKGGRVEISYKDYSACPGHTAVYNNVDFNGKIAFKIFSSSGLASGYWNVNSVSFSGKASYNPIYTVTTVIDGASNYSYVERGNDFIPEMPEKAGEIFIGWSYTDSDETDVYKHGDFAIEDIQEDITIEALFVDLHIIGACVKISGAQGLRFMAQISAENKAILSGLNLEIGYGILLTNTELGQLDVPCVNWFNEAQTVYTAVLIDLEEQHATMDFTAKAYVEIDGVKYYSSEETRSIAYVAYCAVNDYKTQSEDEYIYELETGKFYKEDYSEDAFNYLNTWASKNDAE